MPKGFESRWNGAARVARGAAAVASFAVLVLAVTVATATAGTLAPSPARAAAGAVLRFAAVSGTHGVNHFVLRRAGARLELRDTDTGAVLRSVAFARTYGVSITGANGRVDNTLTLDFSGGSLAVPGGIAYDGGRGGYNALALRGGRFAAEHAVAYTPHAGLIRLDATTVRYADIAPITDTAASANYTITGTAAAETINVVNGPTVNGGSVQTTQVNSTQNTFELTNFANKTNVTVNGNGGGDTFDVNVTTPATALASLAVDGSVGAVNSTFNILTFTLPLSIVGGGHDTANIGLGTASSTITSTIAISDPSNFIAVNVDDSSNTTSSRFVTLADQGNGYEISGLTTSTISGPGGDLASLTISGGSAGNTYVIASQNVGGVPITLNTGTGMDSTFVQKVAAGASLAIRGQNGEDGVALSNAGSTQGILGPVTIENVAGFTGVTIDDSADTTARTVSLSTDGTTDTFSGIAPAAITGKFTDLLNLTVDGGTGGNTFTFAGLGQAIPVTMNTGTGNDVTNVQATSPSSPLNLNGQSGSDTVRLGNAGSVQALHAAVTLTNGSGATALSADDTADTTARTVTIDGSTVTGLAPTVIAYSGVSTLAVKGGAPHDSFTVTPSAATTDTLTGGGPASAAPPGNVLTMTLAGATAPALTGTPSMAGAQGTWTFSNRAPVSFSHMQSLNPTAMSIGDGAATVGGSGSAPLSFAASLLAPSTQPVSATYATADGTATAAAGAYTPANGTVSFPAGTASQSISVSALGRPMVLAPETFTLTLSAPTNSVLQRAVGTGTITDSYVAPVCPAGQTGTPPNCHPPACPAGQTGTPPSCLLLPPVIGGLTQKHARWRASNAVAVIARGTRRRAPVGTTFGFTLNESAGLILVFTQREHGRRAHGHCLPAAGHHRRGRSCPIVVTRGTLLETGHAGSDRLGFSGNLSPGKLVPGRYTVTLTARNSAGQRSGPSSLRFTIVK